MFKEIVHTVFKLLWPILVLIILFILFAGFRIDRYIFDFNGAFRKNCNALNNQKLNAELIRKVPGNIAMRHKGKEYIETKDITETDIVGLKQYIKEQKSCQQANGDHCDDIYNYVEIYRLNPTEDWRCEVIIDKNTYIMTAESDYYTD